MTAQLFLSDFYFHSFLFLKKTFFYFPYIKCMQKLNPEYLL